MLGQLSAKDLVSLFEQGDRGKWPTHRDIAPDSLVNCIRSAQEFDPELYERLTQLNTAVLDPARLTVSEMARLASDFWEAHREELVILEAQFKDIVDKALEQARAALERLDQIL